MDKTAHPTLLMLGPAAGTRDSIASVAEAYRAHGLFNRWPIEYVAIRSDAGLWGSAALAVQGLGRFMALLVQERGLVVHLHVSPERGLWRDALFMVLAIAARAPLIVQLHGTGLRQLHESGRLVRAAVGFLMEQAACVIVPCESSRSAVRILAPRANVECLPPPVTTVEPVQGAQRPNLVLFLGSLDASKGVYDLIEALAALRPAVPDVRLMCAGGGDRNAVAAYAERLGIADAVKFTAWVGPSGKRALLESAAVFARPSYDEALPISLLEAMAAGVPAVVSPVGGVPEFVVDGVSGMFAAPGDVATLQRRLKSLLLDRGLAARIGEAARESVRLRCAPQRVLARLEALYAALGVAAVGAKPKPAL